MKNVCSIICNNSSIDPQTNFLSLHNCVEEIKIEIDKTKISKNNQIVIPVNLQLISAWAIEDFSKENKVDVKLEFVSPLGEVLNEFFIVLKSKKGDKRLRSITNIQGIKILESGRYYYRVSKKRGRGFEVVSEVPLDIDIAYKIFNNK